MSVVTRPVDTAREETDAEIIGRMRADPEAFAAIFDRYYPAIQQYAARRLGRDLADDVAAETFLVAFDQWERYDTSYQTARPWLFGIASNLISGHRRTEARRYRALARAGETGRLDADHSDRVAGRVDAKAVRGRLAEALGDLGAAYREVVLLIAWGGLTSEQTAHALGIPAGTVRSRLHRARQKLQTALGGADPTAFEERLP
jgi:RNA polymerase sigma factor (sigma-70 family)